MKINPTMKRGKKTPTASCTIRFPYWKTTKSEVFCASFGEPLAHDRYSLDLDENRLTFIPDESAWKLSHNRLTVQASEYVETLKTIPEGTYELHEDGENFYIEFSEKKKKDPHELIDAINTEVELLQNVIRGYYNVRVSER